MLGTELAEAMWAAGGSGPPRGVEVIAAMVEGLCWKDPTTLVHLLDLAPGYLLSERHEWVRTRLRRLFHTRNYEPFRFLTGRRRGTVRKSEARSNLGEVRKGSEPAWVSELPLPVGVGDVAVLANRLRGNPPKLEAQPHFGYMRSVVEAAVRSEQPAARIVEAVDLFPDLLVARGFPEVLPVVQGIFLQREYEVFDALAERVGKVGSATDIVHAFVVANAMTEIEPTPEGMRLTAKGSPARSFTEALYRLAGIAAAEHGSLDARNYAGLRRVQKSVERGRAAYRRLIGFDPLPPIRKRKSRGDAGGAR